MSAGQPTTRRERRASERAAHKQAVVTPTTSRSPAIILTVGAVVVGLVIVAAVVMASGGLGGPGLPPVAAAAAPLPASIAREGRSLGDPAAPVHIDVYEDPQCPACGTFTSSIEPLLVFGPIADGRVHLTYHDYVFLDRGPSGESLDAAVGMRAAEALAGRFWEFHDIVFANQRGENTGAFSRDRLGTMAELVGLDRAAVLERLDDPALIAAVRDESAAGASLGISSTPSFVIDGQVRSGVPSWEELSALIDERAAAHPQG